MIIGIIINIQGLRSGANDAIRAANKQYALQKSCYCPIGNVAYTKMASLRSKS